MTNLTVSRPPRRARAAVRSSCFSVMWHNGGREVVRQTPKRPSLTEHHPRIVLFGGDGLGGPLARLRGRMRPAYLPKESALGGCGHLPSVGATLPPTGCGRSGGGNNGPPFNGEGRSPPPPAPPPWQVVMDHGAYSCAKPENSAAAAPSVPPPRVRHHNRRSSATRPLEPETGGRVPKTVSYRSVEP
jgi:hypothetical protein